MKTQKNIFSIIGVIAILLVALFASVQPDRKELTGGVDEQQALAKVKDLPEVQEYQKMLADAGKKATFEVEDQDSEWAVHVFEIVSDGANSHTATFGWFRVDKKTGIIEKEN